MAIEKDKLIWMFETMVRIRAFEERLSAEFKVGNVPGFVHLYIGEEAIAAGACANLRTDDYITSTHRGHGHLIAKGGKTNRMMAELYGKKTGYCKGKGGSMHIADVEIGMLGANGIVASGLPIATGAALSAKKRGTGQVTVCFFGDGATNNARFHEAVNMASAWKLPVVYVIENNQFGQSTRTRTVINIDSIASRAAAYGISGTTVDGNDVLEVYEAVDKAVARARKGEGPALIECHTYRWHGHSEGDPQAYRTKDEVLEWMKKDPIGRFKQYLILNGVLTEKEIDKIKQEMLEEIDEAIKFAEDSPLPAPEETLEDVFV